MTDTPAQPLEIAQKQRYLFLLNKVNQGRPLSRAELKELRDLEQEHQENNAPKVGRGEKEKAAIAADQVIRRQIDAAKYAGVSERTIRRWVKAGMPQTEEGFYIKDVLDLFKSYEGHQPSEDKGRLQKAEADLKEAKAKLAQIDLHIRRGELIKKEEIDKERIARIQAVKRALLGLGRTVASQLPPKHRRRTQQLIDDAVRHIIETFSRK